MAKEKVEQLHEAAVEWAADLVYSGQGNLLHLEESTEYLQITHTWV